MADRMTPEAFFAWQNTQVEPYELVDGHPRPHDHVTVNLLCALHGPLRGTGCRPTTGNVALRTGPATLRRPDVTVEGAPMIPDSYENRAPRLVAEVIAPCTTTIDCFRKLDEYRRQPTLAYILLVETRFPSAVLYRREGEVWAKESFETLDAVIELPAISARLALADIYADMTFEPGRLVR